MITEDYVSFEVAKLLKEKGFDEYTFGDYSEDGIFGFNEVETKVAKGYQCPTLQMAMKWLRKVHNYLILIDVDDMLKGYQWAIYYADSHEITPYAELVEGTYEQACEAAIKCALENLI